MHKIVFITNLGECSRYPFYLCETCQPASQPGITASSSFSCRLSPLAALSLAPLAFGTRGLWRGRERGRERYSSLGRETIVPVKIRYLAQLCCVRSPDRERLGLIRGRPCSMQICDGGLLWNELHPLLHDSSCIFLPNGSKRWNTDGKIGHGRSHQNKRQTAKRYAKRVQANSARSRLLLKIYWCLYLKPGGSNGSNVIKGSNIFK